MVAPDVSSPFAVQEFTSTKTKDVQMTDATLSLTAAPTYEGTNRLILGIVLAVVTFWLFAQTTLNVAPTMRDDLHITNGASNIAVSITALFSGIFIVVAGGLADQFGRVKLTDIGLALSILGSLLIALSPFSLGLKAVARPAS